MTRTLQTLLTDLIDYAGLFPPAKLEMAKAVDAYARHRMGEHEWALGRFVCPASRLEEFSAAAAIYMPGTFATSGYREHVGGRGGEPWLLSALIENFDADVAKIDAFNERHSREDSGLARVDMVEIKVTDASQIDDMIDRLPDDLFPFFEFPVTTDCRGFIAALSGNPAAAKIRTGGVVGNAFPTVDEVAAFLHACASVDVPFKATAGLHHPVRSVQKLTYEKDSASCAMHGFLNLFVAAAVVRLVKPDEAVTRRIIAGEDPSDFKFGEEVIGWRESLVSVVDVARVRESFALSFGSCSFSEPFEDLQRLKLL